MFCCNIVYTEKIKQFEIPLEESIYFCLPFISKVGIPSTHFSDLAGYFNQLNLSLDSFTQFIRHLSVLFSQDVNSFLCFWPPKQRQKYYFPVSLNFRCGELQTEGGKM